MPWAASSTPGPAWRSFPTVLPGVGAFQYLASPELTCSCRGEASAPERDPASCAFGSFPLSRELAGFHSKTSPVVPHPDDALILGSQTLLY